MFPPIGVGFLPGAGVPRGKRSPIYIECGCCSCYHRADFAGDCRDDSERFADAPEHAWRAGHVVTLDDQSDGSDE